MSATAVADGPRTECQNGGVPARRAVIRWAVRLLRREWRQQLLILALITVAVGRHRRRLDGRDRHAGPGQPGCSAPRRTPPRSPGRRAQHQRPDHDAPERTSGRVDVIENQSVQVPGSLNTFDLRAQDPHGPFGGPLLSLVSGQYPADAEPGRGDQRGRQRLPPERRRQLDRRRRHQESHRHRRRTRRACSTSSPSSSPGQVTNPDDVTVLFDAPGVSATSLGTGT